ncbi:MAG: hypothetical protein WD492_05735 [Alkalispirochaeta sp.]
MNRQLSIVLVLILSVGGGMAPVSAQEDQDTATAPADWLDEPAPYNPEEFPKWARDLRRGEIIALGAFPVAMIVSGIGYQLGRFAYQSIDAGQVQPEYAPGFFSPQTGPRYTNSESVGLIVSGALISVGVAVADFLLGRIEEGDTR